MSNDRDPVQEGLGSSRDLYDIATWESRSRLDRLAVGVHDRLKRSGRVLLVAVALLIFVAQLAVTGFAVIVNPVLGIFTVLSIVPAFLLAGYIWYEDVTMRQPLKPLVVTYLLGVLFAGFAAVFNTIAQRLFGAIPLVGMALLFYLVVGPLEETVKWSAVRFYAYNDHMGSVIDGAVYGAAAGLGFATIENTLYITQGFLAATQGPGGTAAGAAAGGAAAGAAAGAGGAGVFSAVVDTAAVRSLAGPGHVLYTSISGYYLGLARFNPENAGTIAVKGLMIAAFVHATYDTLSTYLPQLIGFTPVVFIGFVLLYDGIVGGFLLRKLARYRAAYRDATATTETVSASGGSD